MAKRIGSALKKMIIPSAYAEDSYKIMEKTFEASLAELEQIVTKLEDGDLPLEESLELFEKGIKLSRECRERLTKAERRIEILMKDAEGNLTAEEIDPGNPRDE